MSLYGMRTVTRRRVIFDDHSHRIGHMLGRNPASWRRSYPRVDRSETSSEDKVRVHNYGLDDANEPSTSLSRDGAGSNPDSSKVLTVKKVDLKITANGTAHHTNKYAISSPSNRNPQLVVRRGQPFTIDVEFSKPYDPNADDLKLVFEFGDNPLASKGTHVEFILSHVDTPGEWGAKIVSSRDNSITIDVFTPPTCFVGKWTFKIDVVKKEDTEINVYRYVHKNPIYILFNPWCQEDTVYMPEENLLNEYILNETGRIYMGTVSSAASKPWNYGQFESNVLDVAMYILDASDLNWSIRGNPIRVVRKLSALVNKEDDNGIIHGKWGDDDSLYYGGTPPLVWTGSVVILEEYWRTKQPVRYGQCWVYAAVTTTICRALGIPARCVTNYESAHDYDGSITIDFHFTSTNTHDKRNSDTVWNFHVWNETWMSRPDLPQGYGGWQVIDATPQTVSDGIACCGPTSVVAIQKGEVNLPYDGPFVFAEVNGDLFYWKPNMLGVMECVDCDKRAIGHFISTKAPNSNARLDITRSYKPVEDSHEERAAVLKANQAGSNRPEIYKQTANDVTFVIDQDSENTWVGGSFIVGLRMKNSSRENRSLNGTIVISSMYYTGDIAEMLKSETFDNVVLTPGEEKVQKVEVTQDEYDGRLKDECMLDASFFVEVKETGQMFTKKVNYRLHKPHLVAKAPAQAIVGKEFIVQVSFSNPLNSSLTSCSVSVDGVAHAVTFVQPNVPANGTFTASLPVTAEKVGQEELIIIFNSKQLEDINTACPILIRDA